tara:strand:+ start:358 stop:534 length:177 start_codon:yes stop_codon:yes gene_type:complete
MLRVKKKFKNKTMSNGIVGTFNSSDITEANINKYNKGGFSHIFESFCEKCDKVKCVCK